MKLASRLTSAMVALVLLVSAVVGAIAYYALMSTIRDGQLAELSFDAQRVAGRFEAEIRQARSDVVVAANLPAVAQIVRARELRDAAEDKRWRVLLEGAYQATLAAKSEYLQMRLIGVADGGREIVRVDRAEAGAEARAVPEPQLQQKGDRPYFQATLQRAPGGIYTSRIELNQENGKIAVPHVPVLRLGTPIFDEAGKIFGAALINVDMRPEFARIRDSVRPGTNVYLVNEDGDYLMNPDRDREFGFDLGQTRRFTDDFPGLDLVRQTGTGSVFSAAERKTGDEEQEVAWTTIQLPDGPRILVLLLAPPPAVAATAEKLIAVTGLGLLGAIIVAVILAAVASRSVARPLEQMTESIAKFDREGRLVLPGGGPKEVAILASAFRLHMERERLFASAVEWSSDAILTKSLDGRITGWNRAAEELYGYSAEEIVGRPVRLLVPEDRVEEFELVQRKFRAGTSTTDLRTQRLTKSGARVDVSLTVSPVQSATGELLGASEISRDLTRRMREDALFRMAVEASPAAMLIADSSGRIQMANREAQKIFGYDPDDLVGSEIEMLIPADLRAHHAELRQGFTHAPTRRMMGSGRELFGLRRDRSRFPVEVGLNPIETSAGPMVMSVVVDITERVRNAAELLQRTEELQRSNAELQQFAYVASHDLQEPLRMVSSFCELLKDRYGDKLDHDAVEFIDFAVDGARRMRQLINDLLDYSRLQTRDAEMSDFPLDRALNRALTNLSAAIEESKAEIRRDPMPAVHGNEGQLARVFQNLIGNALKFQDGGRPEVHISATNSGNECTISVRDNGIGIEPRFRDMIFGIFQRLHTRDEYPGTGIGLAVCKRIIERHGGRIWADAAPDRGTVIRFTLQTADIHLRQDHDDGKSGPELTQYEVERAHERHFG